MANPQDSKSTIGQSSTGGTKPVQQKNMTTGTGPSGTHDQTNPDAVASQKPATPGTLNKGSASVPSITSHTASTNEPLSEKVSSTASGILEKAKETASGTYDVVASQATNKIEERKGELSTGLRTLADTFRKTGIDLKGASQTTPLTDMTARYTGTAANQIEKVAGYFERKDLKAMMRDTEGFARRNPAIFLGAAFALGMVAARFLKSSTPDAQSSMNAGSMSASLPTALPPAETTSGATRTA